jgi:hypothetical protein
MLKYLVVAKLAKKSYELQVSQKFINVFTGKCRYVEHMCTLRQLNARVRSPHPFILLLHYSP